MLTVERELGGGYKGADDDGCRSLRKLDLGFGAEMVVENEDEEGGKSQVNGRSYQHAVMDQFYVS
jgi:hypothetical protein